MHVASLGLQNFRNYPLARIEFSPRINWIVGLNAQGKTNLVEGLYFCLQGESYRTGHPSEMISFGKQGFSLLAAVQEKNVRTEIRVNFSPRKKELLFNGEKPSRETVLRSVFNVVSISPQDDQLVSGGPKARRDWLDRVVLKVDPGFAALTRDYQRALESRNRLLSRRLRPSDRELDAWTERWLALGRNIERKRLETLEKIAPVTRLLHRRIAHSAEELSVAYHYGPAGELPIDRAREAAAQEEQRRRMTLVGPQVADLVFSVNGRPIRQVGSQGQRRTAVFSMKVAQGSFVKYLTGRKPVFILDDVLMELDEERRRVVLGELGRDSQLFITGTQKAALPGETQVRTFCVEKGRVRDVD